jgi:hypothetical protein
MACRDWRTIAAEGALRSAAFVGQTVSSNDRLAALLERATAPDHPLSIGAKMLLDAVQDGDRYAFLRRR